MPYDKDQATEELAWIRSERQVMRQKKGRSVSRLEKYRAELVELRLAGASLQDLVVWLRKRKKMKIHRATVYKKLREWPESPDWRE